MGLLFRSVDSMPCVRDARCMQRISLAVRCQLDRDVSQRHRHTFATGHCLHSARGLFNTLVHAQQRWLLRALTQKSCAEWFPLMVHRVPAVATPVHFSANYIIVELSHYNTAWKPIVPSSLHDYNSPPFPAHLDKSQTRTYPPKCALRSTFRDTWRANTLVLPAFFLATAP